MGNQLFTQGNLRLGFFVVLLGLFLTALLPAGHCFKVRQNKFRINDFDVTNRINTSLHMVNVRILKTTHHMHDRIHLANVTQKLVPQSLTLARPLYQPGDIHKLNRRRNQLLRT